MVESESHASQQGTTASTSEQRPSAGQRDLDLPSLETALQSTPEELLDWHLGRGVVFQLGQGPARHSRLELFSQVVRVTVPTGQLTVPRRDAEVAPDGIVFQDPEQFFLSVGPTGEVLFQYFPPSGAPEPGRTGEPEAQRSAPSSPTEPQRPVSPAPAVEQAETKDKAKSERYVGRMGFVRTHRTKQGKLVAEVELTVADPERPGASRLIKCAAFGEKAEALQQNYQPGQEVTAVGIPHELRRRGKDGQAWTERQLYLVQLPKPRESS